MKRGLSGLLISILCQAALSEELLIGDWQGDVTMYNEKPTTAIFRVKQLSIGETNKFKITMFYNERPYDFENLVISEDSLKFALDTGAKYECELNRIEEGGYQGKCHYIHTDETRVILMTLSPPSNGSEDDTATPNIIVPPND